MTKAQKSPRKLPVILMCLLLVVTLAVNAACIALYPAIPTFMTAHLNARLTGGSSALSLSPEEAKQLLKLTGYPPVYVKVERDNAILFGLQKGLDIISMNSLLYELHLELLV